MLAKSLALILLSSAASALQVEAPHALLRNLNTGSDTVVNSINLRLIVGDDQRFVFLATGYGTGSELWVTDGTELGTELLLDASPGQAGSASPSTSALSGALLPDGRGVFALRTANVLDNELWITDFTPDGTRKLVDSSVVEALYHFIQVDGEVWFQGRNFATGIEWWRTDGTEAGTRLAFEVAAGNGSGAGADIYEPFVAGGKLFFAGRPNGIGATEPQFLYASDPDGVPVALLDFSFNQLDDLGAPATSTGNALILRSAPGSTGAFETYEWWVSDGTPAGTEFLMGAPDGGPWSVDSGGLVFFNGVAPNGTVQLYVTDGTTAGTALAADTYGGQSADGVTNARGVAVGDGIVFQGLNSISGGEPYFTDGTPASTVQLFETGPGIVSSEWRWQVAADGLAFVGLDGDLFGIERLLSTDGTPAGTALVPASGMPTTQTQGRVRSCGASVLHSFPGGLGLATPAGPSLVAQTGAIAEDGPSSPTQFVRFGSLVLFTADDGVHGRELWRTDGTEAGTSLVMDLATGEASSLPDDFVVVGDRVAFTADDGVHGRELWWTDGSALGTELIDIESGAESSLPADLTHSRGQLYFSSALPDSPVRLFVSDGTAQGTLEVAPGLRLGDAGNRLVAAGDVREDVALFFTAAIVGSENEELWGTDGTMPGTFLVAEIHVGPMGGAPRNLTVVDDRLYFAGRALGTGFEPFVSDGTQAGTEMIADLIPGPMSSMLPNAIAVEFDGRWVFQGTDNNGARLIWITDGTNLGTSPLAEPGELTGWGTASQVIDEITSKDGHLYIASRDESFLGTPRAFSYVAPSGPLVSPGIYAGLGTQWVIGSGGTVATSSLFFGESDSTLGEELWIFQPGGDYELIEDLYPGPGDSNSTEGVTLGSRVLFGATGPLAHTEPRSIGTGPLGIWVAEPIGRGCGAAGTSTPRLDRSGSATQGDLLTVRVENAAPSVPALLAFGSMVDLQPVGGLCGLLLPEPQLLGVSLTDPSGEATFDLQIPLEPTLVEAVLYLQAVLIDGTGPFLGLGSTTDGLEVVIGA